MSSIYSKNFDSSDFQYIIIKSKTEKTKVSSDFELASMKITENSPEHVEVHHEAEFSNPFLEDKFGNTYKTKPLSGVSKSCGVCKVFHGVHLSFYDSCTHEVKNSIIYVDPSEPLSRILQFTALLGDRKSPWPKELQAVKANSAMKIPRIFDAIASRTSSSSANEELLKEFEVGESISQGCPFVFKSSNSYLSLLCVKDPITAQPVAETLEEVADMAEESDFNLEEPPSGPLFDRENYKNATKASCRGRARHSIMKAQAVCLWPCISGTSKMVIFNKSNALRKLYKDKKPPFSALLTAIEAGQLHPVMVLVERGVLDGVYTKKPICTSPTNVIEYAKSLGQTHIYSWLLEVRESNPDLFPRNRAKHSTSCCASCCKCTKTVVCCFLDNIHY